MSIALLEWPITFRNQSSLVKSRGKLRMTCLASNVQTDDAKTRMEESLSDHNDCMKGALANSVHNVLRSCGIGWFLTRSVALVMLFRAFRQMSRRCLCRASSIPTVLGAQLLMRSKKRS